GSAPGGSAVGEGSSVGSIVAVGIAVGMISLMLGVVIVGPNGVAVGSARVGRMSGSVSSGVGALALGGTPNPPAVGVAWSGCVEGVGLTPESSAVGVR